MKGLNFFLDSMLYSWTTLKTSTTIFMKTSLIRPPEQVTFIKSCCRSHKSRNVFRNVSVKDLWSNALAFSA